MKDGLMICFLVLGRALALTGSTDCSFVISRGNVQSATPTSNSVEANSQIPNNNIPTQQNADSKFEVSDIEGKSSKKGLDEDDRRLVSLQGTEQVNLLGRSLSNDNAFAIEKLFQKLEDKKFLEKVLAKDMDSPENLEKDSVVPNGSTDQRLEKSISDLKQSDFDNSSKTKNQNPGDSAQSNPNNTEESENSESQDNEGSEEEESEENDERKSVRNLELDDGQENSGIKSKPINKSDPQAQGSAINPPQIKTNSESVVPQPQKSSSEAEGDKFKIHIVCSYQSAIQIEEVDMVFECPAGSKEFKLIHKTSKEVENELVQNLGESLTDSKSFQSPSHIYNFKTSSNLITFKDDAKGCSFTFTSVFIRSITVIALLLLSIY